MLDYLRQYGDMTLAELPFNEIDNLLISQLSYCGPDACVEALPCPLRQLEGKLSYGVNPKNRELADAMSRSRRFSDSVVLAYHNEFSEQETKQFCAVTFLLSDGTAYAAFRGTDSTLVGWKEDFMLCFNTMTPAQKLAVKYLQSVNVLLNCPLRVGGHSKGGNLAVYAAAFSDNATKKNITEIWSNDGPGFVKEILDSDGYKQIKPFIRKYIPESSVIGRLLENDVIPVVIDSSSFGLWQHDPYSWKTTGTQFIRKPRTDSLSEVITGTFREWMEGMPPQKRQYMTDTLFAIAGAGDDRTLGELARNPKGIANAVSAFTKLSPDDRKRISAIAEALIKATGHSSKSVILDSINEKTAEVARIINREDKRDE